MPRRMRLYRVADFRSDDPLIAGFADYLVARNTSPRTSVAYQRDLESFGSFLSARRSAVDLRAHQPPPYDDLASAETPDVAAFAAHLISTRAYSPKSIRRKLSAMRTFYKFLKLSGRRESNPALEVPSPRVGRSLPKALAESDVSKLLATSLAGRTDFLRLRDRALLETLYGSGIRRSEIVGLDLEDVDIQRRQMRVVGGKGNKDRTVLFTTAAADAMQL